jgi:glutamyl-tRNA reductase
MNQREIISQVETLRREIAAEQVARTRRPLPHVCGINHTRAPLELLERYALGPEAAANMLRRLREEAGADQALVLSTCNRTELYGWSDAPDLAARLREMLLAIGETTAPDAGAASLYEYRGLEAVRHLFAVESGLDSMILGENYIKQQVRQAWETSRALGADGPDLHRLMQAALRCGKRIRAETELNVGTLESDVAAILKAEQVLGTLTGRTCLVIGAGKIGRRAARAIAERMPARLLIVNRTVETARAIADACRGEAHGLDALPELLPLAEFVLGAAYAPEFVIPRAAYAEAIGRHCPPATVCMVDTAVPRIFDPDLATLPGVRLFDLEHMQEIVEENRRRRVAAAREGWRIVEEEVEQYRLALEQAELAPAIRRLRERFDRIFEEERAALEASAEDEAARRKREAAQRRIEQRLLHEAIVELKAKTGGE